MHALWCARYEERDFLSTGGCMSEAKIKALISRAKLRGKFRGYPKFYTLPVTWGLGLFASEGKHRGAGLGYCEPTVLHLYGADNFSKHGGLSWCKNRDQHTEYRPRLSKPGQVKHS